MPFVKGDSRCRIGSLAIGALRRGDSEWGRRLRRMKGAKHMRKLYPGLAPVWAANGLAVAHGLETVPVPEVPAEVMNPYSVKVRERRRLARRLKALGLTTTRSGETLTYAAKGSKKGVLSPQPVKVKSTGSGRR